MNFKLETSSIRVVMGAGHLFAIDCFDRRCDSHSPMLLASCHLHIFNSNMYSTYISEFGPVREHCSKYED